MIISRAPVRISLGGGGTDLPSYYEQFGGFLIAGAIDQYVFLAINQRFERSIRISYAQTEIVDAVDAIAHPIVREALRLCGMHSHIEIVSIADIPASSGLGTSSCFTVALLNGLYAYQRRFVPLERLAEDACRLEIEVLREPIGKQDQYIAALGGVTCLTFERDGTVHAEPLRASAATIDQLERNLLLFYTGVTRSASGILAEQNAKSAGNHAETVNALHAIKEIGWRTKACLERGHVDEVGELFDVHWETKKQLSSKISDPLIDEWYAAARKAGALGGKVIGAGGGGFLLFYCPTDASKTAVGSAMARCGLRPLHFRFDFEGAKIVLNMRTSRERDLPCASAS